MTTGRLVDGLLRLGHRIQLIRPRQHAGDAPLNVEGFEEVLSRGLPIPRQASQAWPARPQRADQAVVVAAPGCGAGGDRGAAWLVGAGGCAKSCALPVVTEFHTNFHAYSRYYGVGWLKQSVAGYLRRFHNKGDRCLVPTEELAEELRQAGVRAVEVVARGVDTTLFSPARRSESLRGRWGLSPQTLLLAVVGRIAPEKNLELAVSAMGAVAAAGIDCRLLLVGDGPAAKRSPQPIRGDLCRHAQWG